VRVSSINHYYLKVIVVKGRGKDIQRVADGMLALRVEMGKLVLQIPGKKLKGSKQFAASGSVHR
jgi:hypothetical protein